MKPAIANISPTMLSQVSGRSCQAGKVPASLRASFIFTAQAHRKKAAVGASTSTTTRTTMRSIALLSARGSQNKLQVLQHTGSRSPDVALAIRHGIEAALAALRHPAIEPMVPFVEE